MTSAPARSILQQPIEREQMYKLLETRKTDLLRGFVSSRTKGKFSAFLVRGDDGQVGFEFEKKEPKAPAAKRRPAHFALPKKRDFDPDYCMFDTKEWRQFCVEVSAAARDVRSITIRGLLNELDARGIDREFSERRIHDAIEWILATGTIRRCWGELPSRYERSDRTPLELRKRQFNGAIKPPQIKEPDHDSIYA